MSEANNQVLLSICQDDGWRDDIHISKMLAKSGPFIFSRANASTFSVSVLVGSLLTGSVITLLASNWCRFLVDRV